MITVPITVFRGLNMMLQLRFCRKFFFYTCFFDSMDSILCLIDWLKSSKFLIFFFHIKNSLVSTHNNVSLLEAYIGYSIGSIWPLTSTLLLNLKTPGKIVHLFTYACLFYFYSTTSNNQPSLSLFLDLEIVFLQKNEQIDGRRHGSVIYRNDVDNFR